jgi:plasmid maintenance system antidote protein VapI
MTADDANRLRAAADRLGVSQRELARLLELPERDLRHLFAGRGDVPKWLWLALDGLETERKRDPQP